MIGARAWLRFFFTAALVGLTARATTSIALGAWDAAPDHSLAVRLLVAAIVAFLPFCVFAFVVRSLLRQASTLAQ